MSDFLTRRNGTWHFQRRVPKEYASLDPRGVIRHSTKIKIAEDRAGRRAGVVADRLNKELEAYWRGLASGRPKEELTSYTAARQRARSLGFDYIDNAALLQQPFEVQLARVEALGQNGAVNDPITRAALLGTAKRQVPLISQIFTEYREEVREQLLDLSEDQLRIWTNGRTRAVESFLEVIEKDKPVTEITHDDALTYREHWRDRVINDGVAAKTANRQIGQLSGMLKELSIVRRLGLPDFFHGLRLKGETEKDPTPFETDFIQKRILAEGALDRLNEEARMVIYIIADTGLRPSEILNLNASTIFLDAPIPYVKVLPDGRRLKTEHSEREIPLVGCALPAIRKMRDGFKRYHDNSSGFSAAANKFMQENGLRPTKDHTVYSLRHSFKDRLVAIEAQDSLIDSLMGHDSKKPKYGKGPSLELKLKYLKQIALTPPRALARAR
ncbi:tyrosine-type recombinase/integrase [Rhodopseudomonas palustris]|uniref:tyrosine-type recombinase/integrase n=1 Tax=Rhodopseudomonas palustris TaxID=1076 RepID=UPI0006422390|nr:tyrosine-type recombinase/integrase [Rhodopseudomonas palustris]